MAIKIHKTPGKLYATYPNEYGKWPKADLTPLLVLGSDVDQLLQPIISAIQLKRPHTIKQNLRMFRSLGEAFSQLKIINLPNSENGWQQLVLGIHRFVITRSDSKASLQTRTAGDWQTIRTFLVILIDEGIAPVSLYLPPIREVLSSIDISRYRDSLLGQTTPHAIPATEKIDKLLMTISLSRTDSEYLDEVRDTLASRRRILFDSLTDYWIKLKSNLDFGRALIESVDWPSLKIEIEKGIRIRTAPEQHLANPLRGETGLANYLAVIKYEWDGCPPTDGTLSKMRKKARLLPRFQHLGSIKDWLVGLQAPSNFLDQDQWSDRSILWWWQGRISHFDVSMLTALLIMLQPSWTPHAVLFSKITNRDGKQYLDFGEGGAHFEVNKPRAMAMKEEMLDQLSYEIISTLIQEGTSLRESLKLANDQSTSLLFLPYGKTKVAQPIFAAANSFLSGSNAGSNTAWIGTHYPQLNQQGLGKGTITFSKIRRTEGVLEWFRTKSLKAVSRKLGNTERVVLHHYIPKPLLDAWNTRTIRRFQNLWLSTASANEAFLLEVTDFACLEDLHAFLKDLLNLHDKSSSPLAEILHDRFSIFELDESVHSHSLIGHLHVAISEGTLSALYLYHAKLIWLGCPEAVLDKKDAVTGLSPRHFLTLADLLQTRLPEDKNPKFRLSHESAMQAIARVDLKNDYLNFLK